MALQQISSISVNRSTSNSYTLRTPYQVDFSTVDGGKRVKATKRYARWIIGFCNEEAVSNGGFGAACRGIEHEVILAWSVTSSRRVISIDGEIVHDTMNSSEKISFENDQVFQGMPIEIVAYLSEKKRPRGARAFDLHLGGISFFTLPRIFELGSLRPVRPNHSNAKKIDSLASGMSGPRRKHVSPSNTRSSHAKNISCSERGVSRARYEGKNLSCSSRSAERSRLHE